MIFVAIHSLTLKLQFDLYQFRYYIVFHLIKTEFTFQFKFSLFNFTYVENTITNSFINVSKISDMTKKNV